MNTTEKSFKKLDLTNLAEAPMVLKIVSGPPIDRLFDSFRYTFAKDVDVSVHFDVEYKIVTGSNHNYPVLTRGIANLKIVGIEWEDGGGYNMNLHGHIADLPLIKFKAFYSAASREGTITISK